MDDRELLLGFIHSHPISSPIIPMILHIHCWKITIAGPGHSYHGLPHSTGFDQSHSLYIRKNLEMTSPQNNWDLWTVYGECIFPKMLQDAKYMYPTVKKTHPTCIKMFWMVLTLSCISETVFIWIWWTWNSPKTTRILLFYFCLGRTLYVGWNVNELRKKSAIFSTTAVHARTKFNAYFPILWLGFTPT